MQKKYVQNSKKMQHYYKLFIDIENSFPHLNLKGKNEQPIF